MAPTSSRRPRSAILRSISTACLIPAPTQSSPHVVGLRHSESPISIPETGPGYPSHAVRLCIQTSASRAELAVKCLVHHSQ